MKLQEITRGYSTKKVWLTSDSETLKTSLIYDYKNCTSSSEIFYDQDDIPEIDRFVFAQQFLKKLEINVPDCHKINQTELSVENLGITSILDLGLNSNNYGILKKALEDCFEIIEKLIPHYDSKLRHYNFQCIKSEMDRFFQICKIDNNVCQDEIDTIAQSIASHKYMATIHRDFQSSNIMIYQSKLYLIDFQDLCNGPRFYDAASLLYDLKINISKTEQERLLHKLFSKFEEPEGELFKEFYLTALIRLLKSLTLRFKLYNEKYTEKILLEIRKGISMFYSLKVDLENVDYDGKLLIILENYFNKFLEQPKNKSNLHTVILAAGQGKRMGSSLPKVLVKCLGLPMIDYTIRNAKMLGSDHIYTVVGYKKQLVTDHIRHISGGSPILDFINQEEQLGTGHAVMCCMDKISELPSNDIILVMLGDVPVIDYNIINNFIQDFKINQYSAGILTTNTPQPDGCGRIIKDHEDNFIKTIEEKDIPEDSDYKNICEISTGTMIFKKSVLAEWIFKINDDNAQKEFYLPDVINLLLENGYRVLAHNSNKIPPIHGANNPEQLSLIEKYMNSHLQNYHNQ